MPKRIFIRDGGLTASRPIPNGYVAIGTDSGIPRKQILSIISEFTGAVTGNGTTNYVPKWNSVTGLSSTSSIYIDNSGYVGIGTSTPQHKLHISGDGFITNNNALYLGSTNRYIGGTNTWFNPGDNGLLLYNSDGSNYYFVNGNSNDASHHFQSVQSGQGTIKTDVIIKNNGNVGVGTTSPTSRIHIKGTGSSSSTHSLKVDDGADNPLLHVRDDGYFDAGNGNLIAYDNGSNIFIGANSNKYRGLNIGPYNTPFVYFDIQNSITTIYNETIIGGSSSGLVGNTARVKISGDGSIGLRNIGFQYNGNNGFTDYAIGNESDGLNTTIRLSFNPTQFGYGVAIGLDANNSWRIGIGTSSVSSHRVVISDGLKLISTTYNSNSFEIQTSSGTPSFIVQNNGNVGIGTTNPNYKLDVTGDINTSTLYRVGATAGWTGTFSADGQIVSVIGGIITSVV